MSGHALGARGAARWRARRPTARSGARCASGREITGALVTELAHDGDPRPRDVIAADGPAPRARHRRRWSTSSTPRSSSSAAGAIAAGELLLGPGARGRRARARCPVNRDDVRIVPARFGAERGMLGAALHGVRRGGRWPIGMSGRLVVCPTPIGNLEDVTLRVLAALREADVDRLRGHAHDEGAARPLRRVGRARALRRAQRARAWRRSSSSGCAPARWWRSSATPACRSSATRASCSCRRAWPPGSRSRCCPGPSAALAALVACGLPAETWRFVGFLPRKKGELAAVLRVARGAWWRSSRRGGSAASLAVLAALDPERPVAVCRELTKVHEEVVRGTAARAGGALRGRRRRAARSCSSSAARAGRRGRRSRPALAALRRLVDEGGARPRPAAGVVAELTGTSANALYRALTQAKQTSA